jgi:predicted nucleotidyltransferase component of viral defense system
MNAVLGSLLSRYTLTTAREYENALREVVQHLALVGLWRARFFEHAAFYGGTALRVFHGLSRYSEDMDFSLLAPDSSFSLKPFAEAIAAELHAFGLEVSVVPSRKPPERKIESAFLKANTHQSMLVIDAPARITDRMHRDARLKVKLEADTDPPARAGHEMRSLLLPIPIQVRLYDLPSMFAGKLHALLCRSWKSRVKGRDFYDFVWFAGMKTPCNLAHLKARMVQSGHFDAGESLDRARLLQLLRARFATVDMGEVARDVSEFIADKQALELWSPEFFCSVAEQVSVNYSGPIASGAADARAH